MSNQQNKIIGIDLGTTNSCVAIMDGKEAQVIVNREGKRTTPSIVGFLNNGEGDRKVGDAAKRQAITNPRHTISSVKRFIGKNFDEVNANEVAYTVEKGEHGHVQIKIGNRHYTPQEISAMVLQKLKSDAETYLGEKISKAVITVPAYFNDAERQATKEAGQIAGLEVMRIINEPTAAALAYGLNKQEKERKIAVFDLGGGTFDISILELGDGVFEVKSTNGDVHLGGDNFDQALIHFIADDFLKREGIDLRKDPTAYQRLKESAEKVKKELSTSSETEINLPYVAVNADGPIHLEKKITRAQFEQLIDADLKRLVKPCKKALEDAQVKPSDIDEVILVGGSTRIPKIVDIVEQIFAKKPSQGVNPDEVVAQGAAIQGGVLGGNDSLKDLLLLDVTPLSLGIETMGGVFTKIVESNTTIPTKKSQIFSTAQDNQPEVVIQVYQGERPMAKDNKLIGDFKLGGIKPAPRGKPQIEVSFDIDANGILNVSATDKETGTAQRIIIESSSGLPKEEIERMKQEAEKHASDDQKRKEEADLFNQADTLIFSTEKQLNEVGEKLPAEVKSKIETPLNALKKAHQERKAEEVKKAIEEMQKVMSESFAAMQEAMKQQGAQEKEKDEEHTPEQK